MAEEAKSGMMGPQPRNPRSHQKSEEARRDSALGLPERSSPAIIVVSLA